MQQGQQVNLIETASSPTTATPHSHNLTRANHHQNQNPKGHKSTRARGGISYDSPESSEGYK
jgi:hypothetical protein